MSDRRRHSLEQLAHDVRNSAALVSGALSEIRAGLGASAASHEVFLRIAGRGVKQLLILADRCAVEGEHARIGGAAPGSGADLDAALKSACDTAQEAFGKKSLRIDLVPSGDATKVKGSPRWMAVILTETVLLALKSAAQQVRVTALTDGDTATVSVESDGVRPLVESEDSPDGQAFQQVVATLAAMGGSATTNAKSFRLLLTFPLVSNAEAP